MSEAQQSIVNSMSLYGATIELISSKFGESYRLAHCNKNTYRDKFLRKSTVLALCRMNKIVFVSTPSATVAGYYKLA